MPNGASEAAGFAAPYYQLFHALCLVPFSHHLFAAISIFLICLYNFLEVHFLRDFFTGFSGDPVVLTCNLSSELYKMVAAKCQLLHGRFLPTPWLSSPHFQTCFLSFPWGAPPVTYRRHLFLTPDGGTLALDWLLHSDVVEGASQVNDAAPKDDRSPILIVVPGLTSDSDSTYIRHLSFGMARRGWNVVVSNHRGLGGVSMTSDRFYNGGWTEDIKKVISHIQNQHPEAPLFCIGTSLGANILVKYLGEDGVNVPLVGAAAICSPWDLLLCDRFMNRRLVQNLYNRVLAVGLQGFAQLHQSILSRLVDLESIQKSRSVRDFDNHATRVLGNHETVDTYYRCASSVNYVQNVSVPLLCISALDDPVCTREAIPWDECRANENIILATTPHGGHLGFHEGLTATSVWWVRAVGEFFSVLHSSPYLDRRNKEQSSSTLPIKESSIDQGPFMAVKEDGMVTAVANEPIIETATEDTENTFTTPNRKGEDRIVETGTSPGSKDNNTSSESVLEDSMIPIKRRVNQLARRSKQSFWLLAYVAIVTTWPVVGPALLLVLKKKFKKTRLGALFAS